MYVTIEDLRKHLNIDHNEDDAYLRELEEVAEDAISTFLQCPLSSFEKPGACSHTEMKPAIRHAIRLLVGNWYANREDVAFAAPAMLPHGVQSLLLPLKKF